MSIEVINQSDEMTEKAGNNNLVFTDSKDVLEEKSYHKERYETPTP
jgi:hypothetical protein